MNLTATIDMLLKLVFVSGLAWGAFGSSVFDIETFEAIGKKFCKANNAEDKWTEVEEARWKLNDCVKGLFDDELTEQMYKNATNRNFNQIAKTMCSRGPTLKTCVHQLVTNMAPCLPASEASAAEKDASDVINHICDNDGARLATFYNEGGIDCTKEQNEAFKNCTIAERTYADKIAERYGGGAEAIYSFTKEERCSVQDLTASCYVSVWKTCPKPIIGTLAEELIKKLPACASRSFIFAAVFSI